MKMRQRVCIAFLATLFFASLAHANSDLFIPYVTFPTGSWPEAVAIGDVNSDGRNDVVLTTSFYFDEENDYQIFVFLQNASGGLNAPVKYPTNSSYTHMTKSVAIGDVNNDGKNDVVVGNSGSNIEVFLQNDSGGLDAGISYATTNSLSIKIDDLNNDGLLDVVGIGWGTNSVDVLLQNPDGTLDPPVTYFVTHGGYDEVDVGDVNNDGLTDIIVMSGQYYAYPNIGVLIQKADGTFESPVYYDLGFDVNTHGVAVGDVNGDSLEDVVVTYGGNWPSSKIGIFLQNDSGLLDPAISYASYDIPEPVVIADVNNDDRQDIIVAHGGWNALGVYLQRPDGALMPEELYTLPYASHYNPQGLAMGDISGDGTNDVVIADYNHGLVVLYCKETITTPSVPSGPSIGYPETSYTFSTGGSFSTLGHSVQYLFDWGDGTNSGWLPVGTTSASKSWLSGGTYMVKAQARCATHTLMVSGCSGTLSVSIESVSTPSIPNGPTVGNIGTSYNYSATGASSNLGHSVQYLFDWGDGTNSGWLPVGQTTIMKSWAVGGTYLVKAQARCATHTSIVSAFSAALSVHIDTVTTPSLPNGPATGQPGISYTFSTGGSFSGLGHSVQYFFDWGDGSDSGWLSVGQTSAEKSWSVGGTYLVKAQARCATHTSIVSEFSEALLVQIETITTPSVPSGPSIGYPETSYTFSTGGSFSTLGHSVQYLFDWGDGTNSGWLPVGTTSSSHSWISTRTYSIKVQARCAIHTTAVSPWSETVSIRIAIILLQSPANASIFNSSSLIATYQPSFNWTANRAFAQYTILFSISPANFRTSPVLIKKATLPGTLSSWTPPITIWKTIMTRSNHNRNIRDIYWKVIGTGADKNRVESEVRSFRIGTPQAVTIIAPPRNGILFSSTPPTFEFSSSGNIKFKLQFSSTGEFSNPENVRGFIYTTRDPNLETVISRTLTPLQWNSVKKLVKAGGYFRIKAWDGIGRLTISETRSFTIQ